MEINVLEESKNKLIVEIKGEGHALCNALKAELWKNKKVKVSGYNIAHPLVGIPKLVIETESGDPRKILTDAIKNVKKDADAFLKSFSKTVK
ncbi:DNA-directed RNA polymerase subunit L [Candidatus Woesearchaeota archaeon]|jgi:DNA-directed RNA polymerase subunit L|nr:DNA-directed RNA polymerase subunit L [Candidatus Woesearchaeota archaeon]